MGLGESQEAAFTLRNGVPAGNYHVTCDAVIINRVDVTFTLIWRRGQTDTILAQWMKHWDPLPGSTYDAQPYEIDEAAPAIDWRPGDELVFRYEAANTTTSDSFIPNGDGRFANGRIPNIALPH